MPKNIKPSLTITYHMVSMSMSTLTLSYLSGQCNQIPTTCHALLLMPLTVKNEGPNNCTQVRCLPTPIQELNPSGI